MLKKFLMVSVLMLVVAGISPACAQKKTATAAKKAATKKADDTAPSTLIHFITLKWKDDATAEQKQAALDAVKKMVGVVPGLHRVWTKTVKLQTQTEGGKAYDQIIAMEFADEAALKAYTTHPAHDEWYKIYIPIREESRTHDVSN